ncbi:hypothetical protein A2U01_0030025 [Trifolium medium]|uniref:Uncharacterized protein n=1 Tax=Trifolium medium TaxID=97028 RepID=A0A392PA40_9FABA|nr:hypothetical protein [Trifolium medium]
MMISQSSLSFSFAKSLFPPAVMMPVPSWSLLLLSDGRRFVGLVVAGTVVVVADLVWSFHWLLQRQR